VTTVLMTADAVGGVWTYALELAAALEPHGVEVVLATMGPRMDAGQRLELARSPVAAVHESDFALEWTAEPWVDVDAAGRWLLDLAHDVAPDLVHLNGYVHASLAWPAPTVVVAHSDVASWWAAVHGEAPPPSWDEYRRRVGDGLRAATTVVAPTSAMLDATRHWYGVRGGTVVPNCRRPDVVAGATKEPLVLGAGRLWDEAKNVAALDRVAPRLDVPVVIAGPVRDPAGGDDWQPHAATLLGPLPFAELSGWLARASLFVLPARYEPFGLAALEAGLAGCALVLGDIPSLREVWEDAAAFVDPDDDDELAATLATLLADGRARAALGERARARAVTYTPERTAAGYLDVYRRAAAAVAGAA
jgi:glycosyltransferase involved in cell wall biosynthesis